MNDTDATEPGTAAEQKYRPTIEDVSHTHPHTDEPFGAAMAYRRGPTVAADGGRPDAVEAVEEATEADSGETAEAEDEADERMRDVEHTPPEGEDINHVYERGGEGSLE